MTAYTVIRRLEMNMDGIYWKSLIGTTPAYDFGQLMKQHKEDILGAFIEELSEYPQESIQYRALCEGVQALMDTRRG